MITDEQWRIFAQHVKPNMTVRWGKFEGYLLENFPYAQDNDRIFSEQIYLESWRGETYSVNAEGRMSDDIEYLLTVEPDSIGIQLCEEPDTSFAHPMEIEYWIHGDFLTFDQVLALDSK